MSRLLRTSLLVLALWLLASGAGASLPAHEAEQLMSGDFTQISASVLALGGSADQEALPLLEALEAGRLVFDADGVFFERASGTVSDLSGASKAPRGALQEVPVNNAVRRALGPALSQLRLVSNDVAVRRTAADELSKRPGEDARKAISIALSREASEEVRSLLLVALARLDLSSTDAHKQIDALKVIADLADVELKGDVEQVLKNAGGDSKQPPEVTRHARLALSAIEDRVFYINLIANTFYGLSLGSVLLLAALGLAITFGLMRVINMAHGEMLMLGAYTTFVVQNLFASWGLSRDLYLVCAVPMAFLVCALVGMLLERLVVRRLYGRPLETLLATWGISLMLIQAVRLVFGAANVTVENPSWLSGGVALMPTLVVPYSRLAIIGFTALVVTGVGLLLRYTSFGLQIRAVTQNRNMAASMGIPAKRVDLLTFGLGSGLAGLGGVALSQLGNVGPELGQSYIVDSFMVVVLGGVGKLVGSVVGAMGLGLANKYIEPTLGAVLGKITMLVLIVLFIQKRPQGLFVLRGRAGEA